LSLHWLRHFLLTLRQQALLRKRMHDTHGEAARSGRMAGWGLRKRQNKNLASENEMSIMQGSQTIENMDRHI